MTDLTQALIDMTSAAVAAKAAGTAKESDLEFARSLLRRVKSGRDLTANQAPWVGKLTERFRAAVAPAPEAPAAPASPVYPRLAETFLAAAEGLKFPKLRLETDEGRSVVLSRCGERSRTPGWINVTDGAGYGAGTFYGRVSPEGAADFRDAATPDVRAVLAAYDADPAAEAKVQGIRTGRCMCCGKELTDPVSIDMGIGPVCARKWGIARPSAKARAMASAATVEVRA